MCEGVNANQNKHPMTGLHRKARVAMKRTPNGECSAANRDGVQRAGENVHHAVDLKHPYVIFGVVPMDEKQASGNREPNEPVRQR
jgi:hypothetical protein